MSRTVRSCLVLLLAIGGVMPANADPVVAPSLSRAVARAAETEAAALRVGCPALPCGPRRALRRPPTRRAVLTGFLVGAAFGGAVMYREYGSEGMWAGVYTGGLAGAMVGWRVSR